MAVIAVLGFAAANCSEPKAATESNFENAINAYYEANPKCLMLDLGFGITTDVIRVNSDPNQVFPLYIKVAASSSVTEDSDAFLSAGLLSKVHLIARRLCAISPV